MGRSHRRRTQRRHQGPPHAHWAAKTRRPGTGGRSARSARRVRGLADRGPPGHGPAGLAAERTVAFVTAQIRNPHTRATYGTVVTRFFAWCDARGLELAEISPIAVATYITRHRWARAM